VNSLSQRERELYNLQTDPRRDLVVPYFPSALKVSVRPLPSKSLFGLAVKKTIVSCEKKTTVSCEL
jgi:hypothetical protein